MPGTSSSSDLDASLPGKAVRKRGQLQATTEARGRARARGRAGARAKTRAMGRAKARGSARARAITSTWKVQLIHLHGQPYHILTFMLVIR